MNAFKKSLHIWIALTSFGGFLTGWASLAQAARQTAKQQTAQIDLQTIATLPPVQTVDSLLLLNPSSSGAIQTYRIAAPTPTPLPLPTLQPVQQQPKVLFFTPPLRTGGS